MSDIRFNQWLHQSGTGGVSQSDGGHVGIGTTNPLLPVGAGNTHILHVGVVTSNSISAGSSITATTFYGSGANLTSLPAQVTISNNADNRVITGGSGTNLNGEANLTFNGGATGDAQLTVHAAEANANSDSELILETSNDFATSVIMFKDSTAEAGSIAYNHGDNYIKLSTNGTNGGTERVRIDSSGRLLVGTATQFGDGNDRLMMENGNNGGKIAFGTAAGFAEPIIGQMSAYWADNKKVAAISFFGGSDTTNKDDGTIRFATSSANNLTERLRIKSDGNISIGSVHGAKKVHISTTGNQKILIDPNYNNNSGGSSNTEANANNIVESILIRTSFGDNAASQTNAGHKWGIKFQGYNGNDFTQSISKCAGVFAVSEDAAGGYNRQVGLTFHTSPYNTAHREVMRINNNGIVTKPYNPAFIAGRTGGNQTLTVGTFPLNVARLNVGNHYNTSTYKFTAPVAGVYYFYAQVYYNNGAGQYRMGFRKTPSGGSAFMLNTSSHKAPSNDSQNSMSLVESLSVGDTVELYSDSNYSIQCYYNINDNTYGAHTYFMGYLIG